MALGELYNSEDQQLLLERKHARQLIRQYNETTEDDIVRTELLKEPPVRLGIKSRFCRHSAVIMAITFISEIIHLLILTVSF